ncbi:MAG TPA: hypothetical protein VFW38_11000 [Solirubrobacteraceae bacterium]|nr:hypothetical protein [Solirubrobacteraceae bacterium]
MSAAVADAQAAPTPAPMSEPQALTRELCPLCGGPLQAEQDWCLRCGAAARTRLAAPPKWKLLVFSLVGVMVLALAVLIAALVELAG